MTTLFGLSVLLLSANALRIAWRFHQDQRLYRLMFKTMVIGLKESYDRGGPEVKARIVEMLKEEGEDMPTTGLS